MLFFLPLKNKFDLIWFDTSRAALFCNWFIKWVKKQPRGGRVTWCQFYDLSSRHITAKRHDALCPAKSKKRGFVAVKRRRSTSRPRALRLWTSSPTDVNSLQTAYESQNYHNHLPPMPPDHHRLYNRRRAVVVIALDDSKSIRLVSTHRRSIIRRISTLQNAIKDHH